ncbi:MAG: hypothetical protein SFU86_05055 [Pirellulaceae bacterium]|nr:hypothetical protein [Pirellulaceae bacterium]
MTPTREHLLGYLLQALERTEEAQVEQELQNSPLLRQELEALSRCLGRIGLDERPEHFEPPVGLATRTCEFVAAQTLVAPASSRRGAALTMQLDGGSRLRWVDLLAAAAVLLVAATLFFPALSYSHFQADVVMCQNRLRELGAAMHEYSHQDPRHQFPAIAPEGNRGVAGVYAPTLVSHQLVTDPRAFACPSSSLARDGQLKLPTLAELDSFTGPALARYQQTMGGDFGYSLGYTRGDSLVPPADKQRQQYVLLGDAPSDQQPGRASANHGGRGQNLLYEDGHITWIPNPVGPTLRDDPFHNHRGQVAAGIDEEDAVLGASFDRPLPIKLIKH